MTHLSWEIATAAPGADAADVTGWRPATVPATVAQCYGLNPRSAEATELDANDYWYRAEWTSPSGALARARFVFEGLAGPAQVWLNGELHLEARNQFRPHSFEAPVGERNELRIRFSSVRSELARKRPRPRWKTALVANQNLRFLRVSLLGRIPAWCPPLPAIGLVGEVRIEDLVQAKCQEIRLVPGWSASIGATLTVEARLALPPGVRGISASIRVGERTLPLELSGDRITGTLRIPGLAPWWPATHGEPALHRTELEIQTSAGPIQVSAGSLGFRSVELEGGAAQGVPRGGIQFKINGVPVFMRGACWTGAPEGSPESLRELLATARAGGLNLIRIGGTMAYEDGAFYRLCDELGILVWQDFMFANLDYPVGDPQFGEEIRAEAAHQISRLGAHACMVAYCGGSEVQQQAAMMGLAREVWSNPYFDSELPALLAERHPGIPYFPSSPCAASGSARLPFHSGEGLAHYYGVGAYRRPISDVRLAEVRFASECLGFSNVPDTSEVAALSEAEGLSLIAPHHPAWKTGVPRDRGAGYDFEDVRDHYLRELFGLDPVELRAQDLERYYDISRAVSGEVMKRVFAHWRRPASGCGGGIVWFLRDLRAGAGWGLLDHRGRPKAAWRALARAWAPRAVLFTDEGLDGLGVHVFNDGARPLRARIELTAYHRGKVRSAHASQVIEVPAHQSLTLNSDALLGYFADLTHAYRFGPAKHDVVHVTLVEVERDGAGHEALISEDFHFPIGMNLGLQPAGALSVTARREKDGSVLLELSAQTFVQSIQICARGYRAADDSFHLAPGSRREVRLTPSGAEPATGFKAELRALNLDESVVARLAEVSS